MTRGLAIAAIVLLALVLLVVVGTAAMLLHGGLGARTEPSRLEARLAAKFRRLGLRQSREKRNPLPGTPEVIAQGRAHFADHCASCHANDGGGQTEMGRNLYPRAPDLRLAGTQRLTDGELFAIIGDGVRFTGMPAWGDQSEESQRASWALVDFIRHLPGLTGEEKVEMEHLNPKGPEGWREQQEDERFLQEGKPARPEAPPPDRHHHH